MTVSVVGLPFGVLAGVVMVVEVIKVLYPETVCEVSCLNGDLV
jgi:hypothetical protein